MSNGKQKFHSLKLKIILPLLTILLVVFLASSIVIIDREAKSARETMIANANSFSSLSVVYIIDNYQTYYESGFYKFTEIIDDLMALNGNLERLQIIDVNGHILFDSTEIQDGKYNEQAQGTRYLENDTLRQKAGDATASLIYDEPARQFSIIQPYFEVWGRHDYSINFVFSLTSLDATTQGMIYTIALYSGIFILLSFLLIFILFHYFVSSPIGELTKGVRLMGKGTPGSEVKIKSKDEIGELATAFNIMNADLKVSRNQLEEYSKNLENLVSVRTKELEEKTLGLEQSNQDLTAAREQLNVLNKNLEERVQQRTNEVEKLLKQKDEFIFQLGHDLKNPLGPLINLIPLLEEEENDSEKREMLTVLRRNADYMKNLVVKTLDLAILNSPNTRFNLELLNLSQEIQRIINNKKMMLGNAKLTSTIDPKISVKVDRLRLEELVTNIIDNSVKYSNNTCKIEISAEQQNNFVQIAIRDNGIGMTKGQIDLVFNEFYKADSARHDFHSTGLGMSICKRIVEKHGGSIRLESDGPGKGTTVFFTLPITSE